MREIKFRYFTKYNTFLHFGLFELDENYHLCTEIFIDEEFVSQYTGLKDKKGIEIYEGDILKTAWYHLEQIAVVEFILGSFTAKYISSTDPDFAHFTKGRGMDSMWWDKNSEVIGNIYQNPDLSCRN